MYKDSDSQGAQRTTMMQSLCVTLWHALQVEIMAKQGMQAPVEIQVGGRSVVNKDITQYVEIRQPEERFMRLLEILGNWQEQGKVLVFVNSQEQCDKLFRDLLTVGYWSLPHRTHPWLIVQWPWLVCTILIHKKEPALTLLLLSFLRHDVLYHIWPLSHKAALLLVGIKSNTWPAQDFLLLKHYHSFAALDLIGMKIVHRNGVRRNNSSEWLTTCQAVLSIIISLYVNDLNGANLLQWQYSVRFWDLSW